MPFAVPVSVDSFSPSRIDVLTVWELLGALYVEDEFDELYVDEELDVSYVEVEISGVAFVALSASWAKATVATRKVAINNIMLRIKRFISSSPNINVQNDAGTISNTIDKLTPL